MNEEKYKEVQFYTHIEICYHVLKKMDHIKYKIVGMQLK